MEKTNATRLLDASSVSYEIRTYEYSEDDLSGVHAAAVLGMDPDRVFKTLVAKGDRTGICVFCIPVAAELDLKRAAAVSGNKKIEMAHVKDLLALTGYIRGGCSPVGMKKKYPTYIDETAQLYDTIAVSAGKRGMQMLLSPEDLRAYCEAEFADIAQ